MPGKSSTWGCPALTDRADDLVRLSADLVLFLEFGGAALREVP